MSRFLRSLLCRFLGLGGHQMGYYVFGRCPRCGSIDSIRRRTEEAEKASEFRHLVSSWSRLSDRIAAPAIERAARRAGTADTEAPAPEGIPEGSTRPPVLHFDEVFGAGGLWWSRAAEAHYASPSSTGAPVQEAASSTSTPTPSPGSPRSHAGSSR